MGVSGLASFSGGTFNDVLNANNYLTVKNRLDMNGANIMANNGPSIGRRSLALEFSTYCNNYGEGIYSGQFNFYTGKLSTGWGLRCYIKEDGGIVTNGTTLSSDDRLKHNEINITNGLKVIRELKGKVYHKTVEIKEADYNGPLESYTIEAGFIAQEVLEIDDISYCVEKSYLGQKSDISTNDGIYMLNYNNIFTYGIVAIQEVDTQLQAEKEKIKFNMIH